MLNKNTEQIDFSFHVLFRGCLFSDTTKKKIFLVLNAFQILVKMYLQFLIMPSNKSESKSNSKMHKCPHSGWKLETPKIYVF